LADTALLAIDWGTTAARAYRLDANGATLAQRDAALGVQELHDGNFAGALCTLLGDWQQLETPRLACGMIGSRQGWIEAPYSACPVDLASLAKAIVRTPGGELAIIGGITCKDECGVPDVMRGEETQIAGLPPTALERALIVQPGTHSKWTVVADGAIAAFATYMTGETFALLREHSILGRLMAADAPFDVNAFARGVRLSLSAGSGGELLHRLFSARTLALSEELAPSGVADYLSGLLIGSEAAAGTAWARKQQSEPAQAWIVGASSLCQRYHIALRMAGLPARMGPQDAAARGLWRLAGLAGLVTNS
jgi:2-dehydro-3-deoxygalactonokinase